MHFSNEKPASSRRAISIAMVIGLHIALAYALLNGMGKEIVEVVSQPVQVSITEIPKPIPEVKPETAPPAPAPAPKKPQPAYVPQPEVKTDAPAMPAVAAASTPSVPVPSVAPTTPAVPGAAKGPSRTPAVVDSSKCGKPAYPSASQRNEEEGTVTLAFLIGVDGAVLDAKVQNSSGYPALDRAARDGLSLCKFKPATVDGVPEQSWTKMHYVWKLE
ncbi:energy transducer TonB [Herbaspirillum chlorophenolicum]|uniref:energy transducer TonB n=1 Tax=Herbaspirillum chlorophenolicum TaxID=211589 RepID=UPI0009E5C4A9|nr:energy transducer TonB [Herbaspirillum chlorophenolicum]